MGDIDFKVFFAVENSNKFQKPSFGRKNQFVDMVTFWPT
jgi:hypothetical protein